MTSYTGRFAPSPSGPLHMGSLLCAIASFLDAKAHRGRWLLRIEDIDPPREQRGATQSILHSLEQHGLLWDGEVMFQSSRDAAYRFALAQLRDAGLSYRCSCTRKRVAQLPAGYDGHCRVHPPAKNLPAATRFNIVAAMDQLGLPPVSKFDDLIQGAHTQDPAEGGDFIIHRKDELFAYQLAVVVDDIAQNITHVVRGIDLFDNTAKQILLTQALGGVPPKYAHIPVLVDRRGHKLSKQNCAEAIDDKKANANVLTCLRFLNLSPPEHLMASTPNTILHWAVGHWRADCLQGQRTIPLNE